MALTDQLEAITKKVYIPRLIDNVYDTNMLLKRLNGNKRVLSGGTQISIPIEYDELTAAGSYTGYDLLDTTVNEVATSALYEWRQYYVNLGYSRRDLLINQGSQEQVVSLAETMTNNAMKKMQSQLTTGIFQETKANSTDIDGFVVAIMAAGTTDCGTLDSNDFSTWAPQRDTTTTVTILDALNTQWRSATDGPSGP